MIKTRIDLAAVLGVALLLPTLVAAQTPVQPARPADPAKPAEVKPTPRKATLVLPGANLQKVEAGDRPAGADDAARTRISQYYADVNALAHPHPAFLDQQVTVKLQNLPVKDAFTDFVRTTGPKDVDVQVQFDEDVPADRRVTLEAGNVRLGTVLDLICQAGGVNWRVLMKDGKTIVYHVGKTVQPRGAVTISLSDTVKLPNGTTFQPLTPDKLKELKIAPDGTAFLNGYSSALGERRSTFTCPHCKGQATVIRKVQAPECPKCGRTFRTDWQFCPFDGAKRPATTTSDWRYCPICGKRVEMEKSDAGDVEPEENKVPILGDLPHIGQLFRSRSRVNVHPGEDLDDVLVPAAPDSPQPFRRLRYNLDVAPAPGEPDLK